MTKEQKLLNRWTLDLANQLMDEGRTRKAAFKQAHLTRRLMECLGMGTVVFEYEKKDGTVRRARGTLCKGISKDFDHYEYKTQSWGQQSGQSQSRGEQSWGQILF